MWQCLAQPVLTRHNVPIRLFPAAAAVAAVLAYFALRPRKGWLRRKPAAVPTMEEGSNHKIGPDADLRCDVDTFMSGGTRDTNGCGPESSLAGASPATASQPLPASRGGLSTQGLPTPSVGVSTVEPDTLLPASNGFNKALPPEQASEPVAGPGVAEPDTLLLPSSAPGSALQSAPAPPPTAPGAPPVSHISSAGVHPILQPGPDQLPLSYASSAWLGVASAVVVAPAPPDGHHATSRSSR